MALLLPSTNRAIVHLFLLGSPFILSWRLVYAGAVSAVILWWCVGALYLHLP